MKVTLSRKQWEEVGVKAGWIKTEAGKKGCCKKCKKPNFLCKCEKDESEKTEEPKEGKEGKEPKEKKGDKKDGFEYGKKD